MVNLLFLARAWCDGCGDTIYGARIICLVCQGKATWTCVDLCEELDCIAARVERDDLTRPHLPTHDTAKVRRVVHNAREFGKLFREGKEALQTARIAFERSQTQDPVATSSNEPSQVSDADLKQTSKMAGAVLACALCKCPVTQPCWYCIQCEGPSFVHIFPIFL